MVRCPHCNSRRIGVFRLDADWGSGGDFGPANADDNGVPDKSSGYTPDDLQRFECNERPDIDCYVCLQCYTCF